MSNIIHIKRKLVLVGSHSVGKTSLVRKYVLDVFSDDYIPTIGTKVTRKKLEFEKPNDGSKIELVLMIWDVMGQDTDNFNPISAFHGTKGALLVCDLTREETIDNLTMLSKGLLKITPNIPLIFLGNKNDLKNQIVVKESDLDEISKSSFSSYFTTSAKSGENVELVFKELGKLMLKKQGIIV